ncbi:uncharacterized protein LOC123674574 [Harmonia axyridis]|uniref:uncharacterized protein LOC123674574 n=1 Tax=Harmonia axyridis TaxID=115357 RepID=UPI001E2778C5|nr:uncharacterized protein LOC123674574 [Harmonia axyridis]
MFDLFKWILDQVNGYINFYYVVLSIINKMIDCFSKIKIDIADIFAQPLNPIQQMQKDMDENSRKIQKDMEENTKAMQRNFNKGLQDFQNLFKPPPETPEAPEAPAPKPAE